MPFPRALKNHFRSVAGRSFHLNIPGAQLSLHSRTHLFRLRFTHQVKGPLDSVEDPCVGIVWQPCVRQVLNCGVGEWGTIVSDQDSHKALPNLAVARRAPLTE